MRRKRLAWTGRTGSDLDVAVVSLLDTEIGGLAGELSLALWQILPMLPASSRGQLDREFARWCSCPGSQLINVNDPCGT